MGWPVRLFRIMNTSAQAQGRALAEFKQDLDIFESLGLVEGKRHLAQAIWRRHLFQKTSVQQLASACRER